MNKQIKKIGILDGMGAFAGARFFQLTLEKITQNRLPIPEIVLNAVAVDDFVSDPDKIAPASKILSNRIRQFNRQNISLVVMACNTAHIIHPKLRRVSHSEFPSLIDLVVTQAVRKKLKNVGILASPMTIKTKLYENSLRQSGLNPFVPDKKFQILIEKIIRQVLNHTLKPPAIGQFTRHTMKFINQKNLDGLILGCTELPLAFPKDKFAEITILDSLDILADSVVDHLKC